jgi:Uma2 family endonuclease
VSNIWTYADYAALPEDGRRFEVIDGQLIEMPAPTSTHQEIVLEVAAQLKRALERTAWRCLTAPFDVRLSHEDLESVVQPDVMVIPREPRALSFYVGAPLFVLEVISPSNIDHDMRVKRALYERSGVGEYWMLDSTLRTVTVCTRHHVAFNVAGIRDFSESIELAVLPGVVIHMRKIAKLCE